MQHKEPSNASFHLALGIMVSNPIQNSLLHILIGKQFCQFPYKPINVQHVAPSYSLELTKK